MNSIKKTKIFKICTIVLIIVIISDYFSWTNLIYDFSVKKIEFASKTNKIIKESVINGETYATYRSNYKERVDEVKLKSDNKKVLKVLKTGEVKAVGKGKANIIATYRGHKTKKEFEVEDLDDFLKLGANPEINSDIKNLDVEMDTNVPVNYGHVDFGEEYVEPEKTGEPLEIELNEKFYLANTDILMFENYQVKLSYKKNKLKQFNENNLKVYRVTEDNKLLELKTSKINKKEKTVTAEITFKGNYIVKYKEKAKKDIKKLNPEEDLKGEETFILSHDELLEKNTIAKKEKKKEATQKKDYKVRSIALAGLLGNKNLDINDKVLREYSEKVPKGNGIWIVKEDREDILSIINYNASRKYEIDKNGFLKKSKNSKDDKPNKSKTYSDIIDKLIKSDKKLIIGKNNEWHYYNSNENNVKKEALTNDYKGVTIGGIKTDQLVIVKEENFEEVKKMSERRDVNSLSLVLFHEMVHALRGHEGKKKLIEEELFAGTLENHVREEMGYSLRDLTKYKAAYETHKMIDDNADWDISTLYYNGDPMVAKTQEWLNKKYKNVTGFKELELSGRTGWTTIYALRKGLQIELGMTELSAAFTKETSEKFMAQYLMGVKKEDTEKNIHGIIQGALWCKGYSTGEYQITEKFTDGVVNAIKKLKRDAGLIDPDEAVFLTVMQALLSMKQYVTLKNYGGTDKIRLIQQMLNRKYPTYIGLAPCDGLYARDMNDSLIKVLQAIEGYSPLDADGVFGDGTKNKIPVLPDTQTKGEAFDLAKYALICNGYDIDLSKDSWDSTVVTRIKEFQNDLKLPITAKCDVNTWMSLLLSKGNTDRSSVACDTRFEITQEKLDFLKNNGYKIIGRYLTGGDFKELRPDEPQRILDNGLSFFPIFQESKYDISYFTADKGAIDAKTAAKAAKNFRIPEGSVIYFAVDFDPQDAHIKNNILPYFKALKESMEYDYKIGVYGTRNVCTQVNEKGYAVTSFVSNMSYKFSGNMGFKMPENWTFDQFYEFHYSDWDLDKVAYSGKYAPVSSLMDSNKMLDLRNRMINLLKNQPGYDSTLETFSFSKVVHFFLSNFKDHNPGVDLNKSYNALIADYRLKTLEHWVTMIEETYTFGNFSHDLLPKEYTDSIPNLPLNDPILGTITNENKYQSKTLYEYYVKYIYAGEAYTNTSNADEIEETHKKNKFKFFARAVFGSSSSEQEQEFALGVAWGFTMAPATAVLDVLEGLYTAYELCTDPEKREELKKAMIFVKQLVGLAFVSSEARKALVMLIDVSWQKFKANYENAEPFEKGRIIGESIGLTIIAAFEVYAGVKSTIALMKAIRSGTYVTILNKYAQALSTLLKKLKAGSDDMFHDIMKLVKDKGYYEVVTADGYILKIDGDDLPDSTKDKLNTLIKSVNDYVGKTAKEIAAHYAEKVFSKYKVYGSYTEKELLEPHKVLRAELYTSKVIPPPYTNAAHHIVLVNDTRPDAITARSIIEFYGIDVNSSSNGVFLPTIKQTHSGDATPHPGNHSAAYLKIVADKLKEVKDNGATREKIIKALHEIREGLLDGTIKLN